MDEDAVSLTILLICWSNNFMEGEKDTNQQMGEGRKGLENNSKYTKSHAGLGNEFLDVPLRANKEKKIDKWNFMKI